MTSPYPQVMRLTPWVDDPTWGVLRSRVTIWMYARSESMRIVLGPGAGAMFMRQARWLGLDWDDEAPAITELRTAALDLALLLLANGQARKTQFWLGEVAWYGVELADTSAVSWDDDSQGRAQAEPGQGWPIYSALLPDLNGGSPSAALASLVADRAMGVTDVWLDESEIVGSARYLAIARALGWEPPRIGHSPKSEDAGVAALSRQLAEGVSGSELAARAAGLDGEMWADIVDQLGRSH